MTIRHFERQILCRQYIKETGADPKHNPVAHHKHLHEADDIDIILSDMTQTNQKAWFRKS